eukprot:6171911-Pleurochrysis_carterae.AAC.1
MCSRCRGAGRALLSNRGLEGGRAEKIAAEADADAEGSADRAWTRERVRAEGWIERCACACVRAC